MTRSTVLPRVAIALGGVLWIATIFLHPTARGAGSTISGHELADLVSSGRIADLVPRWMGPAWYLMPLGGALLLALVAFDGAIARVARAITAVVAGASALAFTIALTDLDTERLGAGSVAACAGTVLAVGGVAWCHLEGGGSGRPVTMGRP